MFAPVNPKFAFCTCGDEVSPTCPAGLLCETLLPEYPVQSGLLSDAPYLFPARQALTPDEAYVLAAFGPRILADINSIDEARA